MSFWNKRSDEPPSDVRERYDASMFAGRKLINSKPLEVDALLWNLLLQGEVHRLDSKDQLASIAASLAKIAETQAAQLEMQQAILVELRGEAAPARKPQRSFVPASAAPSL